MHGRPGYFFDHVGIAVRSIESSLGIYRAMGWSNVKIEEVPSEKVRVAFIEFENQADVELLEPLDETSVIHKYIEKRGEGIHHICFQVGDIQESLDQLNKEGFKMIDSKPREGAKGCRVGFIHPKSAGGVLIELSQKVEA